MNRPLRLVGHFPREDGWVRPERAKDGNQYALQKRFAPGGDGLYWYRGGLIAIQNGIGSARIARFSLSKDGRRAGKADVLENRSTFTTLPTTGALRGDEFFFIANSGIDNQNGAKILDPTRLEPVKIGVLKLR